MKLQAHLLLAALALALSAASVSALPGRAEVKKISGTASLINAAGATSSLAEGMTLGTGDSIATSASSTVDISLGLNGDVLRVEPDSTLKLDQLDVVNIGARVATTKLNLSKGAITGNVHNKLAAASKYEIRTPSGVAGIRGTVYNASVGSGMSVLHGAVAWTPNGGLSGVTLFAGQSANTGNTPVAIAQAILAQASASASGATAVVSPQQLANTVNTLAQSIATAAAMAVITGGGTQAQAAAAAATAATDVVAQVKAALVANYFNDTGNVVAFKAARLVIDGVGQTTVAAAAIGASTAIVATGGTLAQAATAATAAGNAAVAAVTAATGVTATLTTAMLTVASTAATATATAIAGGSSADAAATSSVTASAVSTTQTVTTSTGTGPNVAPGTIVNPTDVSISGN